ncbi:MAG: hypothetical protein ACYSWU_08465 [Planctomycetota bacterium]|jgi:hypothetical protein
MKKRVLQFTLRDLLLAVVVVSVCLGIGRWFGFAAMDKPIFTSSTMVAIGVLALNWIWVGLGRVELLAFVVFVAASAPLYIALWLVGRTESLEVAEAAFLVVKGACWTRICCVWLATSSSVLRCYKLTGCPIPFVRRKRQNEP